MRSDPSTSPQVSRVSSWRSNGGALSEPPLLGRPSRLVGKFGFDPLNHLYPGMDEPELKIIDVFVCKLRKKLAQATGGNHYIETVWGRGFVLCDRAATSATQKCGEEDLSGDL